MKGYSLLEVVVYVAILAVIFVSSIGSILSIYKGFNKIMVESRISSNGELLLGRVVTDIRSASSTDTGISVFGVNPGILQLGSLPIKFFISGTTLLRQQNGASAENITSSNVKVTNLVFFRDSFSSSQISSEVIKVEFTLEAGEGSFKQSKKFFGSAVLRGAY